MMPFNIKFRSFLKKGLVLPLLFFAQVVYGQAQNREVVLPGGTMTYAELFSTIEKQGNVWLGYATQDIDVMQTVEVPKGVYYINNLLDWLFVGTNHKYTVSGNHILISTNNEAIPEPEPVGEKVISDTYSPYKVRIPTVALKSNLLYDMTTTINLGIEIGLAPKWTIDIPFNYNPWVFNDDTRLRHWGVQPEARYWFCQRFDGWFVGAHAHYAKFNMGGWPDWSIVSENMQKHRYQGHLYGAGVSFGYSWILKNRWSMEATLGLGYAYKVFDKYPCAECGTSFGRETKHYFGPTKVGLSLVFMIK